MRLCGPRSHSAGYREENYILPVLGIELQLLDHPAHSPVPTEQWGIYSFRLSSKIVDICEKAGKRMVEEKRRAKSSGKCNKDLILRTERKSILGIVRSCGSRIFVFRIMTNCIGEKIFWRHPQ
jgi:hypothetical protein